MSAKKYIKGFCWITGGPLSQPNGKQLTAAASCFTSDYREYISLCGSLDAPDAIACGGVRAFDSEELVIGWSHAWRPGTLERPAA